MNNLRYNYVYFDTIEDKYQPKRDGYYNICLRDLDNLNWVKVVNVPLLKYPRFLKTLFHIHRSKRLNRYFNLPLKKVWFPLIFENKFIDEKPLCFVINCLDYPIEYFKYLKHKYPNSRMVLLYRDLRKVTEKHCPDIIDNPILDMQLSYDDEEAHKYGYVHFDEIESKIDIPISKEYPLSDLFFAGKAKDRLPILMNIYEKITKAGLKCSFYLTGVPASERKELPGIIYADSFMPYTEMLYHTVNSRCALDINQSNAVGYTSRFLEAVMYNKRLITNNRSIANSKFYRPDYIQCVDDLDQLDPEFVRNPEEVDYHYDSEFSPIHLIELIDSELVNRYGA